MASRRRRRLRGARRQRRRRARSAALWVQRQRELARRLGLSGPIPYVVLLAEDWYRIEEEVLATAAARVAESLDRRLILGE